MPTEVNSTVFSLSALNQLSKRGPACDPAGFQLERHFAILADERAKLATLFSANEMGLMLDACNGTLFDSFSINCFVLDIEDAIRLDHLDEKWQVDGPKFLETLKCLPLSSLTAIVDAIECWWELVGEGKNPQPGDLFTIS